VCFSLWYLYYHPVDSHHHHRPTAGGQWRTPAKKYPQLYKLVALILSELSKMQWAQYCVTSEGSVLKRMWNFMICKECLEGNCISWKVKIFKQWPIVKPGHKCELRVNLLRWQGVPGCQNLGNAIGAEFRPLASNWGLQEQ
jgi:hypothetical protein